MDAAAARALFDENAATYDRVNSIISLGMDARWRRWVARQAVRAEGDRVLDAFTGTGAVAIENAKLGARVTAVDVSDRMLAQARVRAEYADVAVRTLNEDLTADLPAEEFPGAPFDAITLSFGLRYLDEPARVLRSLARLLRPGGRLVVLEFVRPPMGLLSTPAAWYFFHVLPHIATAIAGRSELYEYLARSTYAMGSCDHVTALVDEAGLRVSERHDSGFGIVCGVVGERG